MLPTLGCGFLWSARLYLRLWQRFDTITSRYIVNHHFNFVRRSPLALHHARHSDRLPAQLAYDRVQYNFGRVRICLYVRLCLWALAVQITVHPRTNSSNHIHNIPNRLPQASGLPRSTNTSLCVPPHLPPEISSTTPVALVLRPTALDKANGGKQRASLQRPLQFPRFGSSMMAL